MTKLFCWYIATTNIKITEIIPFIEQPNISCFDGRYESWHKYTAKRGYIEIVCHKAYENFYKDNPFLHITCRKCLD